LRNGTPKVEELGWTIEGVAQVSPYFGHDQPKAADQRLTGVRLTKVLVVGLLTSAALTLSLIEFSAGASGPVLRARVASSSPRPAELAISDYWRGLVVVTASGHRLARPHLPKVQEFSVSPDGRRIAYEAGGFGNSIEVSRLDGTDRTRVIGRGESPSWSPDGSALTYDSSNRSNGYHASIYTKRPGEARVEVAGGGYWDETPAWSPDGVHIAFEQESPLGGIGRRSGIYVTDGTTASPVQLDRAGRGVNQDPAWSPDGAQLAFLSDRDGARGEISRLNDVFTVDSDGTHLRRLTFDPHRDETSPAWSPDGGEIAYGVSLADGARSGVAVRPAAGGQACLVYATWGGVDEVQWRPGFTAGPNRPVHCSMSLAPRRPPRARLGCSRRAAVNAVNRSTLSLPLKQVTHEPRPDGRYDFHHFCLDFTHDGVRDLVVMFSGGATDNTFHWAAFRRGRHDWHLAASRRGDYMTVRPRGHDVLERQPVVSYRGGFHYTGYHLMLFSWNGKRLIRVARWYRSAP